MAEEIKITVRQEQQGNAIKQTAEDLGKLQQAAADSSQSPAERLRQLRNQGPPVWDRRKETGDQYFERLGKYQADVKAAETAATQAADPKHQAMAAAEAEKQAAREAAMARRQAAEEEKQAAREATAAKRQAAEADKQAARESSAAKRQAAEEERSRRESQSQWGGRGMAGMATAGGAVLLAQQLSQAFSSALQEQIGASFSLQGMLAGFQRSDVMRNRQRQRVTGAENRQGLIESMEAEEHALSQERRGEEQKLEQSKVEKVDRIAAWGAAGAGLGGWIGTGFAPGVGTAIGAGLGSLVGGGAGWVANKFTKEPVDQITQEKIDAGDSKAAQIKVQREEQIRLRKEDFALEQKANEARLKFDFAETRAIELKLRWNQRYAQAMKATDGNEEQSRQAAYNEEKVFQMENMRRNASRLVSADTGAFGTAQAALLAAGKIGNSNTDALLEQLNQKVDTGYRRTTEKRWGED